MFFVTPNRNMFAGKFVKSERFRLAFRLSARKSEIKKTDDVHWNMWTNIKKLYARNNILKKSSKYEILNHLYFGPNFVFWGTALGRFSRGVFFSIFRRRPTMVVNIFTQCFWKNFKITDHRYRF